MKNDYTAKPAGTVGIHAIEPICENITDKARNSLSGPIRLLRWYHVIVSMHWVTDGSDGKK